MIQLRLHERIVLMMLCNEAYSVVESKRFTLTQTQSSPQLCGTAARQPATKHGLRFSLLCSEYHEDEPSSNQSIVSINLAKSSAVTSIIMATSSNLESLNLEYESSPSRDPHLPRQRLTNMRHSCLEELIYYLDEKEIGLLRLTSRGMASKCLSTTYKKSFESGTVRLPPLKSSQVFQNLMEPKQVGLLMRRLTFIAERPYHKRWMDYPTPYEATTLITDGSCRFRANSDNKGLELVRIIAKSNRGLIDTCDLAAQTVRSCLVSLAEAKVEVLHLDVLSSRHFGPLALNKVGAMFEGYDLRPALCNLTHLDLHLCNSLNFENRSSGSWNGQSNPRSSEDAKDVSRLIEICPKLRSLVLRWADFTPRHTSQSCDIEAQFFDHIASMKDLCLERLSLNGVDTNGEALLAFAQRNHYLKRLEMHGVRLRGGGTYKPFFDCIESHCPLLQFVELEDLQHPKFGVTVYFGSNVLRDLSRAEEVGGRAECERVAKKLRRLVWFRSEGQRQTSVMSPPPLNLLYTAGPQGVSGRLLRNLSAWKIQS